MAHRKARRGRGTTSGSAVKFYTTDQGYRLLFDLQNAIDTGEDRELEDLERSQGARQAQQVAVDLLEMGLDSKGVSAKQWVGHSGHIEGYRLSTGESMKVFNAAVGQELLSDDPRQATHGTETRQPLREEDEPFGQFDW